MSTRYYAACPFIITGRKQKLRMGRYDFLAVSDPENATGWPRPAGFWIRVVAALVDSLVFLPFTVLALHAILNATSIFLPLLLSIPSLLYKPLMEAYDGATLGKMACGLRVVDGSGAKLSVFRAYVRFSPILVRSIVGYLSLSWVFSIPGRETVSGIVELGRLQQQSPFRGLELLFGGFLFVDCVTAAFAARKRAIHDMMAQSYCVYKSGLANDRT